MLPLSEEQSAARVGTMYGVMPEGLLPGPVSRLAAGSTGPVDLPRGIKASLNTTRSAARQPKAPDSK
jgi:hypothetical protein